ncbi:MAG: hypothetical protein AAFR81_21520 [Chloroflexota bacterium]
MENETQAQIVNKQYALNLFYGLVLAVGMLTVVALISFFNIPALQDPETGQLPEVAQRAIIVFPAFFTVASLTIVAISNRES